MSDLYFGQKPVELTEDVDKAALQRKKNAESQRQYRIRKKEQEENLQNENAYLRQAVSELSTALQSKVHECQRLETILFYQSMPPVVQGNSFPNA
ncbi:SubName: Full=Uncharacterized protein {ECO:0000313/EMBL:CCA72031.1} [Serendipita indica DSM 11827]|uniref:BZIP domain-containing protein n=1 Tax=Serendipita indica (strain DSM 11827) TaxID=1109443 RepID=G4TL33_SERID|nr:SubName: Full=Uncharacterized protein {ECO:0000313/EMBL:CCA72031.1} [Serendipita indica DSM 11827]CCA72031.1 hypothetical protein PIIN_05967 [Serendipita indica DSM 11827]